MNRRCQEMSHLDGLRVVRGPDWRWGDQDGGEGNAGTVCTVKYDKVTHRLKELLPGMVYVNWDTGDWGKYRCGYQGFHDLRILDSSATGVRHPQISCGDCLVKEISGIRWQCSTCNVNFCTNCFLKEIPHNENHYKFIRYDNSKITNNPEIVSCWNNEGPQSRLKLLGIYPGAVVIPCQPEMLLAHSDELGLVLPNRNSSEIRVEWSVTKKQQTFPRLASVGVSFFRVLKPAIGGRYSPSALSFLNIPIRSLFEAPMKTINTLYNAVKRGDLGAVKLLCKVDVNALCNGKKPVLVLACREGHIKIVEWLLDQMHIDLERPDNNGYRAIHRAIQRCDPEVLELLISKGANLNCQNVNGWTPLHVALVCQYKECVLCVRILIQHGCNTNLQDKEGNTALLTAIRFGTRPEIIKILLNSAGHGVNLINRNGKTALLLACEHQRKDTATIKLLVEAGADTKALDKDGNTAIILAISSSPPDYQQNEMVELLGYLINHGCPWETVNSVGKKAADILCEKGYPMDVIKLLDRTAASVVFKWIDDGSEQGYIEDRFGDKYIWNGRHRKDGSVGYRCEKMAASSQYRNCSGFARRITVDGVSTIELESKHNHGSTEERPKKQRRCSEGAG